MYSEIIFDWLDAALDCGIKEADFWNMTIAEIRRAIASRNRVEKERLKERATFDYVLADLIGRSISRVYSSGNKMPDIAEAYPSIFDSKKIAEERQSKKDELSALRFKLFASSFNSNFKEEQGANE